MNRPMLKMLGMLAACAGLLPSILWAGNMTASADIHFSGSSTLHDFEGTAISRPFAARFSEDKETGILKVSAHASLDVQDMTTDNRKRDKNMFKMFDLDHFKLIAGELGETELAMDGCTQAQLHLKIRNVAKDVAATISDIQHNGNEISCRMKFPVSLKAFDLKGPSVMGLIRVDDTVYVECTIKGQIGEAVAGN